MWFDDLKITHSTSLVTQATDYGVWGDVIREQKTDPAVFYKYGYQGQFAEKDEETGWNHFELREYDPVIGRWLVPDPKRQYQSPYIGMGNNPVAGADPDGAWVKGGGFWRNLFYSDDMVYAKMHADGVNATKNFKAQALEYNDDAYLQVVNKSNGFTTLSTVADDGTLGSPVGYYQTYREVFGSPEQLIKMTGGMLRAEAMEAFESIYVSEALGFAGGLAVRSATTYVAGRYSALAWDAAALYNANNLYLSSQARVFVYSTAQGLRPILLAPRYGSLAWRLGSTGYREMIWFGTKGSIDAIKVGRFLYKSYNTIHRVMP